MRLSLVSAKGDLPAGARVASVVSRAPLRLLLVRSARKGRNGLQNSGVKTSRLEIVKSGTVGLVVMRVSIVLLSRPAIVRVFIRSQRLKVCSVVLVKLP